MSEGLSAGPPAAAAGNQDAPAAGMSLSVAQPAVREWLAKRRATLRPISTFFNTKNFQVRRVVTWRTILSCAPRTVHGTEVVMCNCGGWICLVLM